MGLKNAVRPALTIDEDLHDELQEAQADQRAVVVKPPEEADTDPREAAEEMFRALHGEVETLSFEIHQPPNGRIEYRMVAPTFDEAVLIRNRIIAEVAADVEIKRATLDLSVGDQVAGARLEYAKDHLLPLRSLQSHDVSDAPYSHLLETMADEADARAVIQFTISPVEYSRRFRWGYRLLQLWDERIEPTWTSRWSRWTVPAITTHRRRRKPSVAIASMLSLSMYAVWVFLGGNPFTALPSIQLLDAVVPATIGPVTVPANFSTTLFGAASPIDMGGQVSYVLMTMVVVCLYLVAIVGDGLHWPRRRTGDTEGHRARSKGEKDDRQPSRAERHTGEAIAKQGRDLGYRVNARVLTIADEASSARAYRSSLTKQFKNSWRNTATKQHLRSTTMGRFGHIHHRLPRFVGRVAGRASTRTRWFWLQKVLLQSERRKPMYCAPFELGALCHFSDRSGGGVGSIAFASAPSDSLPPGEIEEPSSLSESESAGALESDATGAAGSGSAQDGASTDDTGTDSDTEPEDEPEPDTEPEPAPASEGEAATTEPAESD